MNYPNVLRLHVKDVNAVRGNIFLRLTERNVPVRYTTDKSSLETPNCLVRFGQAIIPMATDESIASRAVNRICEIEANRVNNELPKNPGLKGLIKDVIFNPPATIVLWNDGTKTVVKAQGTDRFDKTTGLAMAICKKHFGNDSYFNEIFRKYVPEYDGPKTTYVKMPLLSSDISNIKPFTFNLKPSDEWCRLITGAFDLNPLRVAFKEKPETCRERLKREHPEYAHGGAFGACQGCPCTFGYANAPEYCWVVNRSDSRASKSKICDRCWDRPVEKKGAEKKPADGMRTTRVFVDETGPKYELTAETKRFGHRILRRIRAARNIYFPEGMLFVKKGELGGWIESEKNLSHHGSCWISENAKVMDQAEISGNAYVHGYAIVKGNARVTGRALVRDSASVVDSAIIDGEAYIHDFACISGNANVLSNANVGGTACVGEDVRLSNNCTILGKVALGGKASYREVTLGDS